MKIRKTDPSTIGLREKRRRASRASFIAAARELFDRKGFTDTTMAEVAEQAGLHLQTLYKHFPTKQALASALHKETFHELLADRTTDTLTFWRDWVKGSSKAQIERDGGMSFFQSVLLNDTDPKLMGVAAELARDYVAALSRAIAQDLGMDVSTDRLPVLIAHMCWGGNYDAVRRWSASGAKEDLVALTVGAAEEVISIVHRLMADAGTDP